MIQPIGAIGNNSPCKDPEYIKIIQELSRLGIAPTGKKNVDKARLETEKRKIAEEINNKIEKNAPQQQENNVQREKLEEQRLGAMTVAELNKILHGLK